MHHMHKLFAFPETVNEYAARTVAAGVVAMCALLLVTGWHWLVVPLAYGFVARVLSGPTYSPLALLATKVVVPKLGLPNRETAGAPKRFAQGIGATLSVTAVVVLAAGHAGAASVLVAMIMVAASLEAALGFCVGCFMFGGLIRFGLIPESVCAECANISERLARREAELAAQAAHGTNSNQILPSA